jgi:hypothetical protein
LLHFIPRDTQFLCYCVERKTDRLPCGVLHDYNGCDPGRETFNTVIKQRLR